MSEEQMKLDRIQYWSECSTEEKLERTRKAVKQLQRDVALLNKFMRYLQTHSHLPDGSVVIPLFMKDEPQLNSLCFPETGDKVYF